MNIIIIYRPTLQQHIASLNAVFACLEAANSKLSEYKIHMAPSILGLWYTVSAACIRQYPHRLEDISPMKALTSAKEVMRFLGAVNLYRRFIPGSWA